MIREMLYIHFLEAHRISFSLSEALAKGNDKRAIRLRPLSNFSIPFEKEKFFKACKITLAQSLWGKWEKKDYDLFFDCINGIGDFVDDALYKHMISLPKLVDKKNRLHQIFYKKKIANAKKERLELVHQSMTNSFKAFQKGNMHDELLDYFRTMQERKNAITRKFHNHEVVTNDEYNMLYKQYIRETYALAGVEYKDEYYEYFWSFDILRKKLKDPALKHYFVGYENDILHCRI
jgi:hypothetical protein